MARVQIVRNRTIRSDLRYPADYYVSAGASGSGDGSAGNPWTPTQAKAVTHLGRDTYVCWLAGNGSLYNFAAPGGRYAPAWSPTNSGASGARIIHFAEYSAAHLADVFNSSNRTQLSHQAASQATGGPVMGTSDKDYVIFDGFAADEATALSSDADTGVFLAGSNAGGRTGIGFRNIYVRGQTRATPTNYCGFWFEGVSGLIFKNIKVTGFKSTSAPGNHNVAAFIVYGCGIQGENFESWSNDTAGFVKGTAPADVGYNSGYLRWFKCFDCARGLDISEVSSDLLDVYSGLIYGMQMHGVNLALANATAFPNNIRLRNLTIAGFSGSHSDIKGIRCTDSTLFTGANWKVHDNVIVLPNLARELVGFAQSTQNHAKLSNNLYYASGATALYSKYNAQHSGLAAWQSTLTSNGQPVGSRDDNSSVGDPLLDVNYRLQAGSPGLTMGSSDGIGGSGGEIGAFAGNPTLGVS